MDKNERILYTVKEVAELLRCNVDYVHKLRRAGKLKFIKLGQYKVRKETLMKFLEENEGFDLTDPNDIVRIS